MFGKLRPRRQMINPFLEFAKPLGPILGSLRGVKTALRLVRYGGVERCLCQKCACLNVAHGMSLSPHTPTGDRHGRPGDPR